MTEYQRRHKDTKLEWMGEVPNNWEVFRTGKFFTVRNVKVDDISYPPLSVTMSGIVDQLPDVAKTDDHETRKMVMKGDFVINSRSDRKGSSGIAYKDGSVSSINLVLKPRNIVPEFAEHLFKSHYFKEEYFRNGKGIHWDIWTTRWTQFKNINIPIPPFYEQKLIAQYLQNRIIKIDSLIKKIQRKIELTKERRMSLINHCVTKGINADVKTKDDDSGWIGRSPKNWKSRKLKHLILSNTETLSSDTKHDYQFNYIQIGDVDYAEGININKKINFGECPPSARRIVRPKDVIISTVRTYLRAIGIVPDINDLVCSTAFCVLKSRAELIDHCFLFYSLVSECFISKVVSNSHGIAYPVIRPLELLEIKIPLPPIKEQQSIIKLLNFEMNNHHKMILSEQNRIELLKEYRESFISSAVTGKIKITEDML